MRCRVPKMKIIQHHKIFKHNQTITRLQSHKLQKVVQNRKKIARQLKLHLSKEELVLCINHLYPNKNCYKITKQKTQVKENNKQISIVLKQLD